MIGEMSYNQVSTLVFLFINVRIKLCVMYDVIVLPFKDRKRFGILFPKIFNQLLLNNCVSEL